MNESDDVFDAWERVEDRWRKRCDLPDMSLGKLRVFVVCALVCVAISAFAYCFVFQDDPKFTPAGRGYDIPAAVADFGTIAVGVFFLMSALFGGVGVGVTSRSALMLSSSSALAMLGFVNARIPNQDLAALAGVTMVVVIVLVYFLHRTQERIEHLEAIGVLESKGNPKVCGGEGVDLFSKSAAKWASIGIGLLVIALGVVALSFGAAISPADANPARGMLYYGELGGLLLGSWSILVGFLQLISYFAWSRTLAHATFATTSLLAVGSGGVASLAYWVYIVLDRGRDGSTVAICDFEETPLTAALIFVPECDTQAMYMHGLAGVGAAISLVSMFSSWIALELSQTIATLSNTGGYVSVCGVPLPLSVLKARSYVTLALQFGAAVLTLTHATASGNDGYEVDVQDNGFIVGGVTVLAFTLGVYATATSDRGFLIAAFSATVCIQASTSIGLLQFYQARFARNSPLYAPAGSYRVDDPAVPSDVHTRNGVGLMAMASILASAVLALWSHWDLSESIQADAARYRVLQGSDKDSIDKQHVAPGNDDASSGLYSDISSADSMGSSDGDDDDPYTLVTDASTSSASASSSATSASTRGSPSSSEASPSSGVSTYSSF